MSCDCGPILKSLSSNQLALLKNHILSTATKRNINLGVNMEAAAHTHELPASPATTAPAAEVKVEAKIETATAVSEKKEEQKTETKTEEVKVEMVAASEKKAVEDKLVAKEAEFTALSAANITLKGELDASKKAAADIEAKLHGEVKALTTKFEELNKSMTGLSSQLAEYKAAYEAVIPQEKLSEAVLKAASGIVEGYDPAKKVAEHSPATIVKLLKFSDTIAQNSQSTNAGAVETSGKRKKPEPNLVFPGLTIKKKTQE